MVAPQPQNFPASSSPPHQGGHRLGDTKAVSLPSLSPDPACDPEASKLSWDMPHGPFQCPWVAASLPAAWRPDLGQRTPSGPAVPHTDYIASPLRLCAEASTPTPLLLGPHQPYLRARPVPAPGASPAFQGLTWPSRCPQPQLTAPLLSHGESLLPRHTLP